MKCVYFGSDVFLPCLARLVGDGHEIVRIYTFPDNNGDFSHCRQMLQAAKELDVPVRLNRPGAQELESLIEDDAQAFISAAYAYKIPAFSSEKAYGLNLHTSLLPQGRGRWPLPRILLDSPQAAGVTIHQLAEAFDAGAILAQTPLALSEDEDLDSLTAKIIMATPPLLSGVMGDLATCWANAQPQDEQQASHWPVPEGKTRTLDWTQDVASIMHKHRAFGGCMVQASVDGQTIWIEDVNAWQEAHTLTPGTIAARYEDQLVIAAQDGLVLLKRWYQAG